MHLPVVFHIFSLTLPAHLVMESLAYGVGFRLYLWLRKQGDRLDDQTRMTALIGAIAGAGLGSKLLAFAEHPELWQRALHNPIYLMAAKTILGGLLGGIIGVETAKAIAGVKTSTGDLYVFPLIAAIAIGRIGCLLTGISDGTWGDATHFILGFDAGDGVIRHPTPLYEIAFLLLLAGILWQVRKRVSLQNGDLFKLFIMAYCAWRFVIEFLKPVTTYALTNDLNIVQNIATDSDLSAKPGLSMLQMAAALGFAAYAGYFVRRSLRGNNGGA